MIVPSTPSIKLHSAGFITFILSTKTKAIHVLTIFEKLSIFYEGVLSTFTLRRGGIVRGGGGVCPVFFVRRGFVQPGVLSLYPQVFCFSVVYVSTLFKLCYKNSLIINPMVSITRIVHVQCTYPGTGIPCANGLWLYFFPWGHHTSGTVELKTHPSLYLYYDIVPGHSLTSRPATLQSCNVFKFKMSHASATDCIQIYPWCTVQERLNSAWQSSITSSVPHKACHGTDGTYTLTMTSHLLRSPRSFSGDNIWGPYQIYYYYVKLWWGRLEIF